MSPSPPGKSGTGGGVFARRGGTGMGLPGRAMPLPVSAPAGRTAAPGGGPGAPVPAPGERPVPAAAAVQTPLSPSALLRPRDVHPVHRLSLSLSPLSPPSCSCPHHPCPHHLHPCHLQPHHLSLSPSPVLILLIPSLSPSPVPAWCHRRAGLSLAGGDLSPGCAAAGLFLGHSPPPVPVPAWLVGTAWAWHSGGTWLRCHLLSTPCTDTCPAGTATAWGGQDLLSCGQCPRACWLPGSLALPPPQCPGCPSVAAFLCPDVPMLAVPRKRVCAGCSRLRPITWWHRGTATRHVRATWGMSEPLGAFCRVSGLSTPALAGAAATLGTAEWPVARGQ